MNSTYAQLCANLDHLKLGQMKETLDDTIDFISKNSLPFAEGLLKLSNYEVDFKEANASRSMIKAGAFPFQKGLERFQPSINPEQFQDFTTLRFLEKQVKCHELLQQLKRARLENRLETRLKHFCKYKLLIIDELGYLPINKEDSNLFFQLIDMRYEKKSTIITTNINFGDWESVFYDPVVANAILDRVLHHATVVTITGKSYRIKNHIKHSE